MTRNWWPMVWRTVLTIVVIIAVSAGLGAYWWQLNQPSKFLVLPGTVEVQEIRLSSKIGGRVKDVFVDDGAHVKEGDRLVELDVPELKAQRDQVAAQLRAANAALSKAIAGPLPEEKKASEQAVAAAKARLDRMNKGNRDLEVAQVRSDLEAWESDLASARQDLDRVRTLLASKSATQKEYDDANAKVKRLDAQVRQAEDRLKLMEEGFREEEKREAKAEYDRAVANDALLNVGTREEDKEAARAKVEELAARLTELDANLTEAVVTAPEEAIVEIVSVRKGDTTTPNQPVVRVLRAKDLRIKAFVPETELGRVQLNQEVTVTMDTYPDRQFRGQVTYISPSSEFTPRNVQTIDERRNQVFAIKVRVDDPQGIFKSGMAADVWLPKEPNESK